MDLSSELISEFVKATKDDTKVSTETTVHATTVEYNGKIYAKLDGSELLTPISTTADVKADERVTVLIKNHTATITGNMSSPSARTDDVKEVGSQITELEVVMAYKVTAEDIEAVNATIESLRAKIATIENLDVTDLEAVNATIENLEAKFVDVEYLDAKRIEAITAEIETLEATFGSFTDLSTEDFDAVTADIQILKGHTADFTYVSADVLDAVKASIKELDVGKLSAKDAEIKYANIDFANIGEAAFKKLFSDSGIIKDLIVSEGHITGELVGVTLKGDIIEGGTVKADKLVVKGSDGLYYKLNFEAGTFAEGEVVPEDGLHGSAIVAKSITAEKVMVDDLVAFDATIGGFTITENSIYSNVKTSVNDTTRGVHMDADGQLVIGDDSNYLKYIYDETTESYKLEIKMGSSGATVDQRMSTAESIIQQLSNSLSMLITDENGESLMTQTSTGWTFSMESTNEAVSGLSESLGTLLEESGSTKAAVDKLQTTLTDHGKVMQYVTIVDFEDEPCIELGKTNSDFKLRITNTRIMFMHGTNIPTYINTNGLVTQNIEVRGEFVQGGYAMLNTSDGGWGLLWKGGAS